MADTAQTNGKHKAEGPPAGSPPSKKRLAVPAEEPEGVTETGRVYFLVKPRVSLKEVKSISDVQRFYMVLSPSKEHGDSPNRLVILGKKSLPSVQKKDRFFGFVEAVDADISKLTEGLGYQQYETASSGTREIDPSRILGEGVYSIVRRGGPKATNFVYKLVVPKEPSEAQKEFNIVPEGSYGFSIKNPKKGNPGRNVGLDDKAEYSAQQQKQFEGTPGGYAWTGAQDPTLLDVVHCEILMIGATDDPARIEGEMGAEGKEHLDKAAGSEVKAADTNGAGQDEDSKLIEQMQKELAAEKVDLKTAPVKSGDLK